MNKIIQIAKAQGWDTMPKDSPEYQVFSIASEPVAVVEEKPKTKKKSKTKTKRKVKSND